MKREQVVWGSFSSKIKKGSSFFFYSSDIVSEHFFSVLKTLADVLGKGDPCRNIQQFAGGLKNVCRSEASEMTTFGLVQSPPEVLLNAALPKYKSGEYLLFLLMFTRFIHCVKLLRGKNPN